MDKHSVRVLIADDDVSIRKLITTVLQRKGLKIDAATDGVEAIEKLRENEYAVILLDLMMPRTDGFGVVDYLRTNPPAQKPVVLIITAYGDQKFKEINPELVTGIIRRPWRTGTALRGKLCRVERPRPPLTRHRGE
jgi:CheY-like chemotaxis protein